MGKIKKDSRLTTVLIVVLLMIGCFEMIGAFILYTSKISARLMPMSELGRDEFSSLNAFNNVDSGSELSSLLKENGFLQKHKSIDQIIKLQHFIGNSIKNVGVYSGRERSIQLFHIGVSGTPLACGSMAIILNDMLSVLGYEARLVQLYRTDFSSTDTHMVVEVFFKGKWVLFDPTFNVAFEYKGLLIGVNKIQQKIRAEGPLSVRAKYYGDRVYPARLDEYYMDWRPLFSNAFIHKREGSIITRLPPFRWWYGPKYYYFGKDLLLWAKLTNKIYFLFIVVLPLMFFVIFSMLVIMLVRRRCLLKGS